ncbi:universal stress protein [Desulfovibrio sulfodismutans]|uniref:Universal stress protein n=1 Tax=Desulfolutivibrio sulfodismutans TaxID=63561 RepID=A0A7K3NL21_9BACT|nr:universal stress protein [Desulfolutivibrio sulfodismutans]NDY56894.1 universal stress protein [Desulfolutivibrio sulfodismutans]QLA10802.1 universal stress protein [Desulfolutivibrio sulfodismutans DSM 3696]
MNGKHILVAVDGSQNSLRAADYVGEVVRGGPGFHIELVAVLVPPDRDIFPDPALFQAERDTRARDAAQALETAREGLLGKGMDPAIIGTRTMSCLDKDVAGTILAVRGECGCGTVVVGRRGLSKAEEFLLGSISSRVARHAKDFTVWVVG